MLQYETGQGYSALDAQAWRDRLDGYAVVSGLKVSWDSGMTLSVASGEAAVGQTNGSLDKVSLGTSTTITLDAADSTHPRKDTIYIDTTGTVQKETGTPREALPEGSTAFDTYQPEPPFPSTDGTVLSEVWVPAGATSLQDSYVRDRRVPADSPLGGGGGYDTIKSVGADYAASDGELVFVDASTAAVTVTLPAPSGGSIVGVERTDASSNTVTVSPNSTEQVNYGSSEDLAAQGESLDLVSDGTDWYVV